MPQVWNTYNSKCWQGYRATGLPGGSDSKECAHSVGDARNECLIPGSGRSPRKGHGNNSCIMPGESHGQRNLVGYSSPCSCRESDVIVMNTFTEQQAFCYIAGENAKCALWKTVSWFLRKLNIFLWYADEEATVRTRHETMDWFQIGKEVHQSCILSPCLFNLYAQYTMQNARLDQSEAGIINNLIYAGDTTLMAETKKELKSLLMKGERGEWKPGLKLSIQESKIMASGPITSWQIDGEKVETDIFHFLRLQNHRTWSLQPQN